MPQSADWNRVRFRLPRHIPTMITAEERRYLYWLTAERWSGAGHIVEVGTWLGGSTYCLAAGMPDVGIMQRRKLHAFDNFVWRGFMNGRGGPDLADGASFEAHFRQNLAPYRDRLVVHNAWLPDEEAAHDAELAAIREEVPEGAELVAWDEREPVEILFVDGAKSWQGMVTLLRAFAGALVPGRSLLVMQDYKYWGAYWVCMVAELLADCLALEHQMKWNTVAFQVTAELEGERLEQLPAFEDLDGARCRELIEGAGRRLAVHGDPLGELVVGLTQLRMFVHKEDPDAAVEAFQHIERRWPLFACGDNLEAARSWLREASGDALQPTGRSRARRVVDRVLRPLRR